MAEQYISSGSDGEEHTLLGDIVAGRTTFRESLDDIVGQLKESPATLEEGDSKSLDRFKGFVTLVDALGEDELDTVDLNNTATLIDSFKYMRKTALKNAGLSVATGAFTYVPVVGFVSLLAGGWFLSRFILDGMVTALAANAVKHPEKALASLYAAADSLDAADIDSSYIFNLFTPARPRFESAYAALPAREREQVDSQLYRLLGAGGIAGMDERQLKEYLTGLAENAPQVLEVEQREAVLGDDADDGPDDKPDDDPLGRPIWSRK